MYLKNGGNAVDAAITANATMGLMEPTETVLVAIFLPSPGIHPVNNYLASW